MKILIKGLLAMTLALGLWEVILGNTVSRSPGSTEHPILGRINKPGIEVQGKEGFSRTKINSFGMRGEEILPKAQGEYRVLFLGDSYTKAAQVLDNNTYAHLLQEKLSKKSKLKIKSINSGRDGSSPAQYIQLANFYNAEIQPDVVVVQINDLDFTEDMLNQERQFYVVQEKNTFKPVYVKHFTSDNPVSKIFLKKLPQLSFLLEYSIARVGGDNVGKLLTAKESMSAVANDKFQQRDLKQHDTLVNWTVQELQNKYHEKLVILYLPFIDYHNLTKSPSHLETVLAEISKKRGVKFVNMRRDFLEYYKIHRQTAYGFNNTEPGTGHLNEIGHALTAENLADFLQKRISQ